MDVFTWMNDHYTISVVLAIVYILIGLFWYTFIQGMVEDDRIHIISAMLIVYLWPVVAFLAIILFVCSVGTTLGKKLS